MHGLRTEAFVQITFTSSHFFPIIGSNMYSDLTRRMAPHVVECLLTIKQLCKLALERGGLPTHLGRGPAS